MGELGSDLRRVVGATGIYALAALAQKSLAFFLLPVYTRYIELPVLFAGSLGLGLLARPVSGPGLTFGSFFVVDAYSRDGGWICPFCVGDQGPPVVSYEVIDDGAGFITKITIVDDLALLDVFFLTNSVVDYSDFVPGTTTVNNFRVERDNPNQGGFFGAIAADECSGFAFDY